MARIEAAWGCDRDAFAIEALLADAGSGAEMATFIALPRGYGAIRIR
jgi:hypothetical protein